MIPGEIFPAAGDIELNAGAETVTLAVANTGDRPVQVGSHYHFFETNGALAVRPRQGARHAPRHRRRHGRPLRAGADARGDAGAAHRRRARSTASTRKSWAAFERARRAEEPNDCASLYRRLPMRCRALRGHADLDHTVVCNCSRCRRLGTIMSFTTMDKFKLLAGESATTEYLFNKHVIHHLFCSTCGIQSYSHGLGRTERRWSPSTAAASMASMSMPAAADAFRRQEPLRPGATTLVCRLPLHARLAFVRTVGYM